MIELTDGPIDTQSLLAQVTSPDAGAVVLFVGTTRQFTRGRETQRLIYDGYRAMALRQLHRIADQARVDWPLTDVAIAHRLGTVPLAEASVAVAVASPHRADAFAAAQWIMDTLKADVPIWKQEHWADGTTQWVHPGADVPIPSRPAGQPVPAAGNRLIDTFGRTHNNLRISVTDRCNIRCFYCMPDENIQFKPRDEILTYEELERIVRVATTLGVDRVRITGGEPLVRKGLPELIERLSRLGPLRDIALTTNAILLEEQAADLVAAGLQRINISIDTLDEQRFEQITRRSGLDRVLAGIRAAQQAGFRQIRLNAVAIAGLSEPDIVPLGQFAREHGLPLRFIEFMPLDAEQQWQRDQVLDGSRIRTMLESAFGPLVATERTDRSQPAVDYRFADGSGEIGFINPVSEPFCGECNRLRVTAEGQLRNCLFSIQEWDAREILRGGGTDDQLRALFEQCVAAKKPGHGIDSPTFLRPDRAMYQIGG